MKQSKEHVAISLESAYGSVKPVSKPEDFNKISAIEKAEKTLRELREA
jgi:hypothetical protein